MSYPDIIILAGGLGTRLKDEVSNLPKSMAPINGKPFLEYLLNYISNAGFKRVILSTGYLSNHIENYFKDKYRSLEIEYSVESEPLGTGGAINLALKKVTTPYFIVMNGDTFFRINMQHFFERHVEELGKVSIALYEADDAGRYGLIECNENNVITSFTEKSKNAGKGLINGGIYIINTKYFKRIKHPAVFSIEKDWFQKIVAQGDIKGHVFNDYFLDIGIPSDYKRAQIEFNEFND